MKEYCKKEIDKLKEKLEEYNQRECIAYKDYIEKKREADKVEAAELKSRYRAEIDAIQKSKRKINKEIRILEAKR